MHTSLQHAKVPFSKQVSFVSILPSSGLTAGQVKTDQNKKHQPKHTNLFLYLANVLMGVRNRKVQMPKLSYF